MSKPGISAGTCTPHLEVVLARIQKAIAEEHFSIVCQAIVDLESGNVVGFESLARFTDAPQRPPDAWFEEAGTVGLRPELEIAAVHAALEVLDRLPTDTYLSLNVSPDVASDERFVGLLAGAPVERLVVEITEQTRVDDYDRLNAALAGMRSRGLRVALDDAGAGFAGMAHVVKLKPDVIKLDRSLVTAIEDDPRRQAFVSSLVAYVRSTGGTVVAEGVETEPEWATLRGLGVRCGQGFLFARPAVLVHGSAAVGEPVRALARKGSRRATRARARRAIGRTAVRLGAATIVLTALMIPTSAMAQNALPGNPMWQVKIAMERLRIALDANPVRRLERHLAFAERRVEELSALLPYRRDGQAVADIERNLRSHLTAARSTLDHTGDGTTGEQARRRARGAIQQYVQDLQAELASSCSGRTSGACDAARRLVAASNGALQAIAASPGTRGAAEAGGATGPDTHPRRSPEPPLRGGSVPSKAGPSDVPVVLPPPAKGKNR